MALPQSSQWFRFTCISKVLEKAAWIYIRRLPDGLAYFEYRPGPLPRGQEVRTLTIDVLQLQLEKPDTKPRAKKPRAESVGLLHAEQLSHIAQTTGVALDNFEDCRYDETAW